MSEAPPVRSVPLAANTKKKVEPTIKKPLTQAKRKRAPPRKYPVKPKQHKIWDLLQGVDAGLSVLDWLALDKNASRDLIDGLRTLRARKIKKTSAAAANVVRASSAPAAYRGGFNGPCHPSEMHIRAEFQKKVNRLDVASNVGTKRQEDLNERFARYRREEEQHKRSAESYLNGESGDETSDTESLSSFDGDAGSMLDSSSAGDDERSVITIEDSEDEEINIPGDSWLPEEYADEDDSQSRYPYSLENMRTSSPLKAPISINGEIIEAIFDSGAAVSVMNVELAKKLGLQYNGDLINLTAFDAHRREMCKISVDVPVKVAGHLRSEHICIQTKKNRAAEDYLILGTTWFRAYGVKPDVQSGLNTFPIFGGMAQAEIQGYSVTDYPEVSEILALCLAEDDDGTMTATSTEVNNTVEIMSLSTPYHEDVLMSSGEELSIPEETIIEFDLNKVPEYLRKLVEHFKDCFVENNSFGRVKTDGYVIELEAGAPPITARPYRLTWEEQEYLKNELQELLRLGVIEPSTGKYSSPCFFIKKKGGGLRMVINYQKLNKYTVKTNFYLPPLYETVDSLAGSKFFTTMDCVSGYHQVPIDDPETRAMTSFITSLGVFQFTSLSFGLTGAPQFYQTLMTRIFKGWVGVWIEIFIDDFLIHSKTQAEHEQHIKMVLQRCKEVNLRLKFKKCMWSADSVEYLGHQLTTAGLGPLQSNVDKVLAFPPLKSQDETRAYLGTLNYYHAFIKDYAEIVAPLNALLRKNQTFVWSPEAAESFEKSKKALTEAPLLSYPDRNQVQILTTDASGHQIGCILSQSPDGSSTEEKVIAYNSRSLRPAEKNYSAVHLEALAIVTYVQTYRHYLLGRKFKLKTDSAALSFILKPTGKLSPKLSRWAAVLMEYDYDVTRIAGKTNPADAISRLGIQD